MGNIPAAFGNVNELGLVEALPLVRGKTEPPPPPPPPAANRNNRVHSALLAIAPSAGCCGCPANAGRGGAQTEREIKEAFKEYGDVVNVTLRKKGGEFDEKSWALVTFTVRARPGRPSRFQ